ncbi:hypothetical protein AZE42_05889 [Rhizopogon vesiculosus]|uniref:Reverse transcriptase Ty1/copia-type domain-containing protein n=1 Tax=Rhizopogon vesiculosus TaxID=180088 RepID=A0A1J8QM17_9AGAM|nr:hypothetical protein AZE42_05889 [Rhizopogon vesiculosus]
MNDAQNVLPQSIPSTPPKASPQLPIPTAPRSTRIRPPLGYYKALNEGEMASVAAINKSELDAQEDVLLTSQYTQWALAAAEPEPTLQQALNGPDAIEWQEVIDYEISQLEKLGAWEVVNAPLYVNVIPCHYVLATKRGPDGKKLKL